MPAREYTSFLLAIPRHQLKLREETWVVTGAPDERLGLVEGAVGLTASLNRASTRGWSLETVVVRDSSTEVVVVLSGAPKN